MIIVQLKRACFRMIIVLFGLLSACAANTTRPAPTAPPTSAASQPTQALAEYQPTAAPPPAPTHAPPATSGQPSARTYTNPVYDSDFPDPFVMRVGGTYYGFATNVRSSNVPVIRSTDLSNWERLGDALPRLPSWAAAGQSLTWAPAAIQRGDKFVLYYTARYSKIGLQCITRATSQQPQGPYTDDSSQPLICQTDLGGSIDPSPFVDTDGKLYLLWKNDGNCCGKPVGLWVQQLSDDGLTLVEQPSELIRKDQAWEEPLIEGPALWKDGATYYLFYSANWWESKTYAVGYAVCQAVIGPCRKPLQQPIFAYMKQVLGPGGQELFTDAGGNLWMSYAGWTAPDAGYRIGGERSLRIDRIGFADGKPVIVGPTSDPQPLP
ncbi:MAG: glycoside hydrolase family 43 protein [Chloroflexota bacterium]|nr:glycoside hydrolase family 43 protein [Chloroflexota bacterium]